MIPRSPSLRISVLQRARLWSSSASGLTTESWSPSANRASRSFGVMRSKSWNSRIFPHRLATWLSATRNTPAGIAAVGIVERLAEAFGELAADGGLSGAHHAHQEKLVLGLHEGIVAIHPYRARKQRAGIAGPRSVRSFRGVSAGS